MKLGIMQPYFLPYIGYFQLINYVDQFVIYDTIKYTKKGWINRNRYLLGCKETIFTIPLKSGSSSLFINERFICETFDRNAFLRRVSEGYRRAPFFEEVYPLVEDIVNTEERNLFEYIYKSITKIVNFLSINTIIYKSSDIESSKNLMSAERVLGICKDLKADEYINPIGGVDLYSKQEFLSQGISISFLKSVVDDYEQFGCEYHPNLSVIDILMHLGKSRVKNIISNDFRLV